MDVGVSNFELSHPFVKEAFDKYGTRFQDDEEDEEHLSIELDKQEVEILELRKAMTYFKAIMNDMWNNDFKQQVPP